MKNITIGLPVLASLRKVTPAFLDCHVMVTEPEEWVDEFSKAGADMFTFHLESVVGPTPPVGTPAEADVERVIAQIRRAGMYVGIAINPSTPAEALFPYCSLIDLVRSLRGLLSSCPGRERACLALSDEATSRRSLMLTTLSQCSAVARTNSHMHSWVQALVMTVEPGFGGQKYMPGCAEKCRRLRAEAPLLHIQVDGGISLATVEHAASCGANVAVAGTAIFGSAAPGQVITGLRSALAAAGGASDTCSC